MSERSVPDRIELRGLRALAICGALPEEQTRAQPVEVDVDIAADLSAAGRTDDLDDTIDYAGIAADVERVLTTERFTLLERLAERLAEVVLVDERVVEVTVAVRKLRPPVPQQLDTTGVRITRAAGTGR
jgi:FolB domain-containing protein